MSEASNPDALVWIVGARCDVCGHIDEIPPDSAGPVHARELRQTVWHIPSGAPPTNGKLAVLGSAERAKKCGGRVMFATEPYEAAT